MLQNLCKRESTIKKLRQYYPPVLKFIRSDMVRQDFQTELCMNFLFHTHATCPTNKMHVLFCALWMCCIILTVNLITPKLPKSYNIVW